MLIYMGYTIQNFITHGGDNLKSNILHINICHRGFYSRLIFRRVSYEYVILSRKKMVIIE